MNCPMESRNPEMLVAYTAGELDQETARALERHLAGCAHCRGLAAEQAAVWQALDMWEAPPVSPGFDRSLYRRIDQEVHLSWWERLAGPFRPVLFRQVLPLTATASLLLMAGLILERQNRLAPVVTRSETVRAEQVEKTLDDLELLRQFGASQPGDSGHSDAM